MLTHFTDEEREVRHLPRSVMPWALGLGSEASCLAQHTCQLPSPVASALRATYMQTEQDLASGGCAPVQPLPGGVLLAQCLCSPQNSRQSPNPQREGTVSPLHPNFQAANLLRCKCVPSAAGVSETAACPPSPTADDPSALPLLSSPPPSSHIKRRKAWIMDHLCFRNKKEGCACVCVHA